MCLKKLSSSSSAQELPVRAASSGAVRNTRRRLLISLRTSSYLFPDRTSFTFCQSFHAALYKSGDAAKDLVRSMFTPALDSLASMAAAVRSFTMRRGWKNRLPATLRMWVRGLASMAKYRQAFHLSLQVEGTWSATFW